MDKEQALVADVQVLAKSVCALLVIPLLFLSPQEPFFSSSNII